MGLLAKVFGTLRRRFGARAASDPNPVAHNSSDVAEQISHALVLPDQNFQDWYKAAEAYTQHFERVAVVRSPAGNDLNRYRNITAVQASHVWLNDNALQHIRRVYRSVVRVDTIKASTPAQLKQALQQRIQNNDRYGERLQDGHLNDRFVLNWPVDALPARIVTPFNADLGSGQRHEGVSIYAPAGTVVRAPVSGTVALVAHQSTALGYGQYVQISVIQPGISYLVTLTHLNSIQVRPGQSITAGEPIGVSDLDAVKLVVQAPGKGLSGYHLPHVVDPTDLIYWNTLRLRPTDDGLRVRKRPGTGHEIITKANANENLETLEMHGRTLAKVGRAEQWLNVRTPNGKTGYSAAWFLNAVAPELVDNLRLTGVNLDLLHPLGRPAPQRLGSIGWVRLNYNVSYNPQNNTYGNTNLALAYARCHPYIEQYARAGYKVIVALTHQTYGEGIGFNWNHMDSSQWLALTMCFVQMAQEIAAQYAGKNLVYAYQIWNEQDAPADAPSAVPMLAGNYAFLLGESIRAIRAVDPRVKIITGGHTGGPVLGKKYAQSLLRALPPGVEPDGLAVHPYGRGTSPGLPYAPFGHIDDEIESYLELMPGKPLWITEWGVLDHPNDPPEQVADYARKMVQHVRSRYPGRVAALVWYAWAQSMHNGYGLVGTDDRPRQPLYDEFVRL